MFLTLIFGVIALQLRGEESPIHNIKAHSDKVVQSAHSAATDTEDVMFKELFDLQAKVARGGPLTHEAFDPVIGSIREKVRSGVTETITKTQGDLDAKKASMEKCGTDFDFQTKATEYNAASGEHTTAGSTETTKCDDETTACENRDNAGKALFNTVKGSQGCSATASTEVADVTFDTESFPLADVGYAQTIIDQHKTWSDEASKCGAAGTECSDAKTDTVKKCAAVEKIATDGKSAYDTCYDTAKGEFDGIKDQAEGTDLASPVETQKKLIKRVESLLCYIKVAIDEGSASEIECETNGEGDYECTCKDGDTVVYGPEVYEMTINVPDAPTKDTTWDDKGCTVDGADSGDGSVDGADCVTGCSDLCTLRVGDEATYYYYGPMDPYKLTSATSSEMKFEKDNWFFTIALPVDGCDQVQLVYPQSGFVSRKNNVKCGTFAGNSNGDFADEGGLMKFC